MFNHTTLADARAAVLRRLNDASGIFWLSDEVDDLIRESLQVWQCATLNNRCRAVFSTTPGQAFYDISPLLFDGTEFVLQRTVTAQQIAKKIIYHLTENAGGTVDGSTWVGTSMFTLDDVNQAIYRRTNRFLEETGQIVTRSTLPVSAGNGRVEIPTEWIDVRRASWITPENAHNVLWRTSEYVLDSQFHDWNLNPGMPGVYSVAVSPAKELQLVPAPSDVGTLELLMVNALTTTGVLNIFNDFGWVIKWGAIADLLGQDGEARDADRSQYAEQRWTEGVQLALIMSTVLRTEINGQTAESCSLFDLDAGMPGWQNAVGSPSDNLATPDVLALAGPNLVALYPVPGETASVADGKHSISMDVVRNAIVPVNDGDHLQIPREDLTILIDLVCHQAAFKQQGQEFLNTMPHLQRVWMTAAERNARLKENSKDFPLLAMQEEGDRPRLAQPAAA